MKTYFYYERDRKNRPIVTVCLIKDGDMVGRGIAICSDKDIPCKKVGRAIAFERARSVIKRDITGLPVFRDSAIEQLNNVAFYDVLYPIFKAGLVHHAFLRDRERKMIYPELFKESA